MTATPTLTICVPSRNRQYTFKETIRSLVMSPRLDVQFVFADNSDDPSIMNDFMKDVTGDPRVTYLPTDDRIHPMSGNWERCVEASIGDFICVIGDDDYVDPDVAQLLKDLSAAREGRGCLRLEPVVLQLAGQSAHARQNCRPALDIPERDPSRAPF